MRMETSASLDAFGAFSAPVPGHVFVQHLFRAGFSPEAYGAHFRDVSAVMSAPQDFLSHFLRHGLPERRLAPMAIDIGHFEALARLPIADTTFRASLLSNLATNISEGLRHPYGPDIAQRWPCLRRLRALGARPFLVVGDSHAHQFVIPGVQESGWLLPIRVSCEAGSAAGLGNPASRTGYGNALQTLMRDLEPLPDFDRLPVLVQFGQVDIEFVYHFRRIRDGRITYDPQHYRRFCDEVLEAYLRFLVSLFPPVRRSQVVLVSIFPPAVSDAAWKAGWFNDQIAARETNLSLEGIARGIRMLEVADLRERTRVHLHFNHLLRLRCGHHGFRFMDAATPLLGADELLDPRYVSPETAGFDHHINGRTAFARLLPLLFETTATTR
jgi:hypothetical protein